MTRLDLWQRKNNFGSLEEDARRVSMAITKDRGPIKITGRAAVNESSTAWEQIQNLLSSGPKSREDVTTAFSLDRKTVNKAVQRRLKSGVVTEAGGVLSLV
jgi:hypothetical protein